MIEHYLFLAITSLYLRKAALKTKHYVYHDEIIKEDEGLEIPPGKVVKITVELIDVSEVEDA